MEVEIGTQLDVVQQQQIQALLANVEELTCQNKELRKTMKSQNIERRWTGENQNEEELNSQANRRDKTSREDSTRVENELRKLRKEVDKLKSAMKDKGGENLDGMIRRMDSPFTNEVLNCLFPPKLCFPQFESYDSFKDPLDQIESFKTLILLQMTPDEVMCRVFPTTLKGAARVWFCKIPPGTIADFKQLSKGFVRHFIGGQRHKKPIGHLLNIQQAEVESLRQYVTRFNKKLLQVDEVEDQVIFTTF